MALLMPVICALLAFAVDLGYAMLVKTQAQVCADAAALAGASALVDDRRLTGDLYCAYKNARNEAVKFAALNPVGVCSQPVLRPNYFNCDPDGDILLGRLENPTNLVEPLAFSGTSQFNAVQVTVRFEDSPNPRQPFFFARVMGYELFDATATATAIFEERISGFKVKEGGPRCSLMPFVVDHDVWIDKIINGNGNDHWSYERDDRFVVSGGDGTPELKMYPTHVGEAINGIPHGAGNFGTIDIGNNNNSTTDLERQIRYGPSAADLVPFGGILQLSAVAETLDLNGDTGISSALKDPLGDVVGQPRTIMLYDQVTDSGDNTYYRIVGFAGITIVDVDLTTGKKHVTIQPTYVADSTAVTGESRGQNYYVGHSARLVR